MYYDYKRRCHVWELSNGTEIPIKELTDTHLMNIINLLTKAQEDGHEYWGVLDMKECLRVLRSEQRIRKRIASIS